MGFIRPAKLLMATSVIATLLCLYMVQMPTISGVWALVCISACLSLMFPTIYAISLHGLGDDAKLGAAGLVMAILGGAIVPVVQAVFIDTFSVAFSYIVPAGCFIIVAGYAAFDLKTKIRTFNNVAPC